MQPTQNSATLAELPAPAVSVLVTPASVLRAAAVYLDRHGWVQGEHYDHTATVFTPAACVVGAIGMVCYGGPVEAPITHVGAPGFAEFEQALTWLDWYLWNRYGQCAYDFNDAKGRTVTDVILVLDEAADGWEREQQRTDSVWHAGDIDAVAHVDYPHHPGFLYDCPACESRCYCSSNSTECVHCTILGGAA